MTRPDVTAGPIERKRRPEKADAGIGSGVGAGVAAGAGVGVWAKVKTERDSRRQKKTKERRSCVTIGFSGKWNFEKLCLHYVPIEFDFQACLKFVLIGLSNNANLLKRIEFFSILNKKIRYCQGGKQDEQQR